MSAISGNLVHPIGHSSPTPDVVAPDGSEVRYLVGVENGATKSSVVEVTLATGEVTRPVKHNTVEEIWYVLEGSGKVWRCPLGVAPESVVAVPVSPGDALAIPVGWSFQFSADTGGSLKFICHTTPPWPGGDEAVIVEYGGLGSATV